MHWQLQGVTAVTMSIYWKTNRFHVGDASIIVLYKAFWWNSPQEKILLNIIYISSISQYYLYIYAHNVVEKRTASVVWISTCLRDIFFGDSYIERGSLLARFCRCDSSIRVIDYLLLFFFFWNKCETVDIYITN